MPSKPRLDSHRSLEIASARLSPRFGCGLMLAGLPPYESSDALMTILTSYGYERVFADKPAQKIIGNSGLLKQLYDNAFNNKTAIRQNFRSVFGHLEVMMVLDASRKTVWFVADPHNRMALYNYYRDAVAITLKSDGRLLLGSTPRLTPVGWQNLHDLLSDDFFKQHANIERVEILSVSAGVRWREPTLGLGLTLLNMREFAEIQRIVASAFRGETGTEIHD